MWRRRPPAMEEHVDEEFVRRRPPFPSDEPWAWVLLAALLIAGGIVAGVLIAKNDDEKTTPTSTVVETRTAPSTTVVATQTSTQTTSPTATPGTMPETLALSQADAVALVEQAGLIPDTYPVESEAEPGRVVAQNPDPGTQLSEGEHVRLNVSTGAGDGETREVPDVTGPAEADARRAAVDAGFTVRTEDSDAPSSEELGEAVDQAPAAGSRAPAWSQITIYVGR